MESSEIRSVDVVSENLYQWNIEVKDYLVGETKTDFQDLLVLVSEDRARVIEAEVEPMATRMEVRNKRLNQLGDALAIVADIEANATDKDGGESVTSTMTLTESAKLGLEMVGCTGHQVGVTLTMKKAEADYYQQMLKSKLDSLNNAAQDDTTRLQSLVDRRDEAYSTATSLMQAVGDTRANTIKNMA